MDRERRTFVLHAKTAGRFSSTNSLILNVNSDIQGNEVTFVALKAANHRSDLRYVSSNGHRDQMR